MLTYGATCHFIVPELDAGNQIIQPNDIHRAAGNQAGRDHSHWAADNEPRCLVEGVRRVVQREVQLHFHRVIALPPS